ncbi:MAG TPA: hypothetical protein VKB35_05625 [Ktedonobacteraceae bacterium]|nr:hypothetical protein [Ktedonobacteraceae bacterium]
MNVPFGISYWWGSSAHLVSGIGFPVFFNALPSPLRHQLREVLIKFHL